MAIVNYLDTNKFSDAINAFKQGVEKYNGIKHSVQSKTVQLMASWDGEGATQFDKDYEVIYKQLDDLADVLYDLYDALIDAQAAYIKTDEALAKQFTV